MPGAGPRRAAPGRTGGFPWAAPRPPGGTWPGRGRPRRPRRVPRRRPGRGPASRPIGDFPVSRSAATAAAIAAGTAQAPVAPFEQLARAGSASICSGSGRSISIGQARNSTPRPSPTAPDQCRTGLVAGAGGAPRRPSGEAAISQVRGDGQRRPADAASDGGAQASASRTRKKAETRPRDKISSACHPSGSTGTTRAAQPCAKPFVCHRPRVGLPGQVAQPVGQRRGGQIPSRRRHLLRRVGRGDHGHRVGQHEGRRRLARAPPGAGPPARRSGAVDSFVEEQQAVPGLGQPPRPGRGSEPHPLVAPTTMGSPAKSEGSRIEAITVSCTATP